jgi:DNA-directed RNA polymerase specialized sigma24 family protein
VASELDAESFARLLDHLDGDRGRAGERYEDLRRALVRFFEWRGAPFPEDHTDETFDRVARRLAEGVAVKHLGGYCYEVARLVFLETLKGPHARRATFERSDTTAAPDESLAGSEKEARMACLDNCLSALPAESRELIVAYYRDDKRERIVARRALAERLDLRAEALANRAQRVRNKLERCMNACLRMRSPT